MTTNSTFRHKTKRTRKFIRRITQGPTALWVLSKLGAWYLKLVVKTNDFIVEPSNALEIVTRQTPVIVSVWHGQHILLPALPLGLNASAMISRNFDGEITARIVEYFGNKTIRASGGRKNESTLKKGGMAGFLEMLKALDNGENVIQTADIPRGTSRRVGLGIIMLARKSGAPIIPLAIASSRRRVFDKAWDRTALNLPFGTTSVCVGESIRVPEDSSDEQIEEIRNLLETQMQRITQKAYALCGKPE